MLLTPKQEFKREPKIVTIISSPTHSVPPHDIHVDVSYFMVDDYGYLYNGLEPIIQNTLYSLHEEFFINLALIVFNMNVESGLIVVLSSREGERRAVAAAEVLAGLITSSCTVKVYHKGLDKWFQF